MVRFSDAGLFEINTERLLHLQFQAFRPSLLPAQSGLWRIARSMTAVLLRIGRPRRESRFLKPDIGRIALGSLRGA